MTKPIVNVNVGGPTKPSCTYKTKVLKGNLSFASQIADEDTKYVIKFDFDLDGGSVTIPIGCLLEFDGGSLSNGTVVGQDTILIYHQAFADILHDVTTEGSFVWDKITTDDESLVEVDGVLEVNTNGILAKHIKNGEVSGAKLNADVVDDSSLEISGNKIKAKDSGIQGKHLNSNVVDDSSLQLDNNKLKVKAAGIQGSHLNSNVADGSSLELSGNALHIKANGVQGSMLNENVVDDEDIQLTSENKLQFKDKAYNAAQFSGLGRKYLRKNIVSNKNVLTQDMMNDENTIYVIQYDYDLNDPNGNNPIQIPENSVLKFDGGSIDNGKLVLNNASIESSKPCFGDNIQIEGKILQEASPEWFVGSDADKIEKAINTFRVVKLAARDYLIDRTIYAQDSFKLSGAAFGCEFGTYTSRTKSGTNQSRLIPTNASMGSVLACVNPQEKYVSVCLSGVDIRVPKNESWYDDAYGYSNVALKVNGFAFSTPGGPSRPVVIENCSFEYLKHAIYIFDFDPSLGKHTNINNLYITGCNISGNIEGIHAEGIHALNGVTIAHNVIEGNVEHGIYCYNPDDSIISNNGVLSGLVEITDNLMEGQTSPIFVSVTRGTLIIKGNYLETPRGSVVTVRGKELNASFQTVILDSGTSSTNDGSGFIYDLRTITLIDRDNGNASGQLLLQNVFIKGTTNKKIYGAKIGYEPTTNSVAPLVTVKINPDVIFNNVLAFTNYKTSTQNYIARLPDGLPIGKYRLVSLTNGLTCNIKKTVSSTTTGIANSVELSPTGIQTTNKVFVCEGQFDVNEAVESGAILRIYPISSEGKVFSGFAIYQETEEYHSLLGFNPMEYVNDVIGDIVNPVVGFQKYYAPAKKTVMISAVSEGHTIWKDLDGFTPAISVGNTAERPSTLTVNDIGFKYNDTEINKTITFSSKDINEKYSAQRGPNSSVFIDNPFQEDDIISVLLASSNVLYNKVELSFCKSEVDESDKIELQGDLLYYNEGSSYKAKGNFVAPSPSVYTKIKIANNATGYRRFTLNNAVLTWLEDDGAVAGVSRNGVFANKPVGSDIYVGFKYFCTDKQTVEGATDGIEIYYKGQDVTDPENPVDVWVDALGRVVDN